MLRAKRAELGLFLWAGPARFDAPAGFPPVSFSNALHQGSNRLDAYPVFWCNKQDRTSEYGGVQ